MRPLLKLSRPIYELEMLIQATALPFIQLCLKKTVMFFSNKLKKPTLFWDFLRREESTIAFADLISQFSRAVQKILIRRISSMKILDPFTEKPRFQKSRP